MRSRLEERTAFSWSVKEPLLKETKGRCAHCGASLDRYDNLTVDHVIPLDKGGSNSSDNLTVLCEACNTLKSNMILPPMNWYPFLSVRRRKTLTAQMRQYMRDTDYLAEDCLIPVDMFRIEVPIVIQKKTGPNRRTIRMPAYINGTRMEKDDAFAWLMEYKRSLQYRDAQGTIQNASEFLAPCYLFKKGDIEVAMANPWMIHEWDDHIKNYRNEIIIDWFFSPSLPERDYLPEMLEYMVMGLEAFITRSISGSMEGACAVLFRTRCFLSDRFCEPVFDRLCGKRNDDITEFNTGHSLRARIRELGIFYLLGEKGACQELKKKMKQKSPDGYLSMEEAMEENANLNKRFQTKESETT